MISTSILECSNILESNKAVLLYFSTTSCAVGEAIQPKVTALLEEHFSKIMLVSIDLNFSPELAAHYNAFVEPTILVFFEGKEFIRRIRNISIAELKTTIERPYKLIFE